MKQWSNDKLHRDCNKENVDNAQPVQQHQQQPPLDSCVLMQQQLNRLKALMETIFSGNGSYGIHAGGEGVAAVSRPNATAAAAAAVRRNSILGMSSLNDPSVIESTPVHHLKPVHKVFSLL